MLAAFSAYDSSFIGGVSVAVGDFTGDGVLDIITGAGAGGGPHVKVFDGVSFTETQSFFAFAPGFRGGVSVAAADVNADGSVEIVVGAGAGGGPHVMVFELVAESVTERASYFAFASDFRGGVNVASGDLDGDGKAELVFGAGAGGAPIVSVFDGATGSQEVQIFAGEAEDRGGVQVAVRDLDGNGANELVARTAGVTRVFDPLIGADLTAVFAADLLSRVFVG